MQNEIPSELTSIQKIDEWLAILAATKTNPTLKDVAEQLRVLYYTSDEYKKRKPHNPNSGLILDG